MMNLNLSDEVLAEIGKITVVFGLLEASLSEIIGAVVTAGGRRHELGVVVAADLSFGQRVSTLNALLLLALGENHEVVADYGRLKPLLFEAERQRNTVVHSVWAKNEASRDPHAMFRIKATAKPRRGLRMDFEPIDLAGLRAIAGTLGNAYGQLSAFELHFRGDG